MFKGSSKPPPRLPPALRLSRGAVEIYGEQRAYLPTSHTESIPPVAVVTEPSAGRASKGREARRMYCIETEEGEEREKGEGVFDTRHNFDYPPSCLQKHPPP